ncbi:MAG TPA: 16S rRNA (cytosine(1402)-N(4))-methyltransferase RsmH [Candidatus Absconditabacterales bacterium]|nr:16S rRNA (cytosine(1402)-N(4))-methyltransferase RsmH [Candidatus Absconditabacterales bacterium]HOQ78709.1 16S rRNA (cytosine(1402)-N(4))-methyltransferase RsmH [Candidatus Absconditabacterales bacterium]HPK27721.1 16S rRNA (cytosine(1402)-N(4))-methyltransferase RsmH [Candidatus Absconditabacterales bacterium]
MINHFPVMLNEVLESIPMNCKIVVDGTLGHGGHSRAILEKFPSIKKLFGFDLDPNILEETKNRLKDLKNKIEFIGSSYVDIPKFLGGQKADFVLLDLGVNMEHFKDGERGFSLNYNSKLDMRFDNKNGKSAYDIINDYSEQELIRIFVDYAEFSIPKAQEIARIIVRERKNKKIETTFELKNLLNQVGLGQKASTIIFQAIRIETNKEIDNLKLMLDQLPNVLSDGGRCGIITFHSLEDRIVKNYFKDLSKSGLFELVYKKAIPANYQEVLKNRASRSAKYRVIEKIFIKD